LSSGKRFQAFFQLWIFRQWHSFAAPAASQVMVMVMEGIAQFQLVFPANLQALDDTHLFEQSYCTINTGPVYLAITSQNNFVHRLRLLILKGRENNLAGFGQALAMLFESSF
jgi:hypothetical protein